MKSIFLFLLLVSITFFSCKKENVKTEIPPQEIVVVEIIPKSVAVFEEFVGQIYGEKDIPIRARVEGYLEGIHFEEGKRVKKGDLLYVIDSATFKEDVAAEQSRVSEARTNLIQAESDLARVIPLAEIDALSQRDLENAKAKSDGAKSSLNAAIANLNNSKINLSYARIRAPIDGIIGKTMAKVGEFVGRDPNPVILNTVSDIDSIRVEFFLSEIEYLAIARDYQKRGIDSENKNEEKVQIELILADGQLFKHKGIINFIDRSVNSSTGAILIQGTFPNPNSLIRPGQFARVKIKSRVVEDAILVPQKCVTELQGTFSVLTVDSENKVKQKAIIIGGKKGRYYIVDKGLNANDKLVLEGLQKVRSGMTIVPKITEFEGANSLNN
jgi:membrane fusion protein (multidrug efflux system)